MKRERKIKCNHCEKTLIIKTDEYGNIVKTSEEGWVTVMIRCGKEWKRKSQRPNKSGYYTVANDNFSCITIRSPYSKKHDLWGVTDSATPEEIEEFRSVPIVAELMRGENGWWK